MILHDIVRVFFVFQEIKTQGTVIDKWKKINHWSKKKNKIKKTIVRRHLYKETKAPHTTSNGRGRRDTLREPKEDHFGGWNMLHAPTQYNRSPTCQRLLNTYQLFLLVFFHFGSWVYKNLNYIPLEFKDSFFQFSL